VWWVGFGRQRDRTNGAPASWSQPARTVPGQRLNHRGADKAHPGIGPVPGHSRRCPPASSAISTAAGSSQCWLTRLRTGLAAGAAHRHRDAGLNDQFTAGAGE